MKYARNLGSIGKYTKPAYGKIKSGFSQINHEVEYVGGIFVTGLPLPLGIAYSAALEQPNNANLPSMLTVGVAAAILILTGFGLMAHSYMRKIRYESNNGIEELNTK